MVKYKVKPINDACTKIYHDVNGMGDWEQWYLLTSDWHLDNPHCDQKRLFADLEKAKARNAGIFCFGDLFCAMQGVKDRRGNKSSIRPEHLGIDYFDRLVNDAVEKLSPYSENIVVISNGNHETAILRHNETDLLARLAYRLNAENQASVIHGGYGGYIQFLFQINGTRRQSVRMKFFHGSGGSSPVTGGAIDQQRAAARYPTADMVYMGHIHQRSAREIPQEALTNSGKVVVRNQLHLRGSTYKDEYGDGTVGWAIEKGMSPSPIGGWWLRFFATTQGIQFEYMPS